MRTRLLFLLSGLFLSSLFSPRVRADVVGPPPDVCPAYSSPSVCHGASYCSVDSCMGSADCDPGEDCVLRELCVEITSCFSGLGGEMRVADVVADSCAGCSATCQNHFVCSRTGTDAGRRDAGSVDSGTPRDVGTSDAGDDPRHVSYCGCSAPSSRETTPGFVFFFAAVALLVARRAR